MILKKGGKAVWYLDSNQASFHLDIIFLCTTMTHRLQTKRKRRSSDHQGRVTHQQTKNPGNAAAPWG